MASRRATAIESFGTASRDAVGQFLPSCNDCSRQLNRMNTKLVSIQSLAGRAVTWWQGGEMALAEAHHDHEVRWEDPGIPFLQFTDLVLRFEDGKPLRLCSQIEDGSGLHGLHLVELNEVPELRTANEPLSIFRERPLPELPLGEIEIVQLRHEGPSAIVEVRLLLSGGELRLIAAEVHEEHDGSLTIVEPDESILVQVNGARPAGAA